MPSLNLGRVSIVPKGAWSSSTTYEKLDVVTYEGSSYIAKNNTFLTTSITNSDYWQLFAEKGKPGTSGEWGLITGDINDQYDLQEILNSKPNINSIYTTTEIDNLLSVKVNSNDLGDFAFEDDAPEDDKEYVRKNGEWTEKEKIAWGDITGELNNQTDLQQALDSKADIIKAQASGSVVSISDGAPYVVDALSVGIEAVQDLHGYDAPWPAGGGKNLFGPDNLENVYYNSVGTKTNSTKSVASDFIAVSASTAYTLSVSQSFYALTIVQFDANKQWIKNTSGASNVSYRYATLEANTAFVRCICNLDNTSDVDASTFVATYHPQLELGSSATSYAPYSNLCPISGHTQATVIRTKNILQNINDTTRTINGVTFTINADKSITLSGTATSNIFYNLDFVSNFNNAVCDISKFRGMQMCISLVPTAISGVDITFNYFDSNGSNQSPIGLANITTYASFVVPTNAVKSRIYIRVSSGADFTTPITVYPMLEVGNAPTTYQETYAPVTIQLGSERYGGVLDVNAGALTITRVTYTLDGTEGFVITDKGGSGQRFNKNVTSVEGLHWEAVGNPSQETSSHFLKAASGQGNTSPFGRFYISSYLTFSDNGHVFEDASDFNAWLAQQYANGTPVQVSYNLATPQTVTGLTPETLTTLLGNNVLWASTGDISNLTYRADTKLYIDQHDGETIDAYTKNETDTKLALKANLASPALTGNPTAPTQASGTNNTRIATTAFVQTAIGGKADKSIITYTESAMTATTDYNIGDLIIVGTNLYKATAPISSGTSLSTSSNVVATTLAVENALKANTADVYSKTDVDTLLSGKSDVDHNYDDRYYKKPEVDVKMNQKADLKSEFVGSGSVVQFEAVNDHQISDMQIDINPIQDLHGYDSPWPTGGGKNKFDISSYTLGEPSSAATGSGTKRTFTAETYVKGLSIQNNWMTAGSVIDVTISNGTITLNSFNSGYGMAFVVPTLTVGQTYTFSLKKGIGGGRIGAMFYAEDGTFISGNSIANKEYYAFTVPADTVYSLLWIRPESSNTDSVFTNLQLELGENTTPSYVPYSNSNICSITGHTSATVTRVGKNLLNQLTEISGTSSQTYFQEINVNNGKISAWHLEAGKTYTLSMDITSSATPFKLSVGCGEGGFTRDILNTGSFTSGRCSITFTPTASNISYGNILALRCPRYDSKTDYTYSISNIQLEESNEATAYEPYQSQSVTIQLGEECYGGVADLKNGVMRIDKGFKTFDGSETWNDYSTNNGFNYRGITNMKSGGRQEGLCNWLKVVGPTDVQQTPPNSLWFGSSPTNNWIYVINVDGLLPSHSVDNWKAYLTQHPLQVVYPLAIPIEIPLTPTTISTLIGQNTVWADTGDISISLSVPIESLAYEKTENKADVILDIASGAIASFEDGAPYPVEELTVDINPVQDLHGYDNPWPAGGGKNLYSPDNLSRGYYNSVGNWQSSTKNIASDFISVTASTAYVLSVSSTFYSLGVTEFDENKTWIKNSNYSNRSSQSITLGATTAFIKCICNLDNTTDIETSTFVTTYHPQFELGSSATSYFPYSNICPITGHTNATVTRTGVNLFDLNSSEHWWINSANIKIDDNNARTSIAPCKQGDVFTISSERNSGSGSIYIAFADVSGNILSRYGSSGATSATQTAPANSVFCYAGVSNIGSFVWCQLELGSTASTYQPYQGQQITIDLNGTRYGGTLDIVTGVMRVTHQMVDMGDLSWSAYTSDETGASFYALTPSDMKLVPNTSTLIYAICSRYKRVTVQSVSAFTQWDGAIANALSPSRILARETAMIGKTPSQYASAISGTQLVYELAEPITVTGLTPATIQTLLGSNVLWSDTGDVSIKYRADTKLYIEKLTQPSEDDMTANANIENGKFFMVGNNLYFSTAAISAGTTIIPGTNCTRLSLADALNNLNS